MTISYNVAVTSLVLKRRLSAVFNVIILQTLYDRPNGSKILRNKNNVKFTSDRLFFDSTLKIVKIYLKTMLSKNMLPQEQSEDQSHDMPNCFQKTFREHFVL